VRRPEGKVYIIGNLQKRDKTIETSFNKPYLPWLITVFDIDMDLIQQKMDSYYD
jgi:hypothetical protein